MSQEDTSTQTQTPNDGNWYDTLPDDVKGSEFITKYESMEDMARNHIITNQMIGRDTIPVPKTDEEFRDVYIKLGAPSDTKDYAFGETKYNIPETIYTAENQNSDKEAFRQWAGEAGLTQKQFSLLYDKYMKSQEQSYGAVGLAVEHEMAKCGDALKMEWGERMDTNITIANRALNKVFGSEIASIIDSTGLGRNPAFVKGMYQLGAMSLEELGIDKHGSAGRTPTQLQDEIAMLQSHPAYLDKAHPEHASLQEKVKGLFERLYPE